MNVYITAGNDNRQVSVGGRQNTNGGWCRVNTDNGTKSDCAVSVSADVVGEKATGGKPRATCHQCGRKWVKGHWEHPDAEWSKQGKWVEEEEYVKTCPQCGARRQGIDTRKSCFRVTLPEQCDENCEVRITTPSERAADIVRFGAALATIQGIMQEDEGARNGSPALVKSGKVRIKQAVELLEQAEAEANKNLPSVILPGGVTLAHALACVRLVNEITGGKEVSEN